MQQKRYILSGLSLTQYKKDLFFVFRLLFNFSWRITILSLVPITSFLLILFALLVSWTPRFASTATSLFLLNSAIAILSIPKVFCFVKNHLTRCDSTLRPVSVAIPVPPPVSVVIPVPVVIPAPVSGPAPSSLSAPTSAAPPVSPLSVPVSV